MHSSVLRLLDYARRKVRAGITIGEIGRQLGASPAVMTNWKARGISKEGAIKAEALFGCSVNWLLQESGREDSSIAPQEQAVVTDPVRQGIGMRLESARQQRKLSTQDVATAFRVDSATVLAWEAGRVMPDAVAIRELAKLYDVSVDGLLWEDSLSPEAMQLAAEFDSLNEKQKRTLSAMWMAFIRESASDLEVEDRMQETKRFKYEPKAEKTPFLPAGRGMRGDVQSIGNISPKKGSSNAQSDTHSRVPVKKHSGNA